MMSRNVEKGPKVLSLSLSHSDKNCTPNEHSMRNYEIVFLKLLWRKKEFLTGAKLFNVELHE